jgi:predicted phage-related endonuclease
MNGMKFNAALIFAIVLQAVALVWYISKIDSRVNILYEKYEVDSDAQVVENQVRMKLSIETLIEDVEAIQKELSKARSKDKKIMKQHEEIFELLQNNTSGSSSYSYD